MSVISGKVWKFGDGIDTDIIIPARYLILPLEEMKHKAMEPLNPEFASKVKEGDIIVAGKNFGCGSSREQAPAVLKSLGIRAIVAISFARIFYRNAVNLGIPVLECKEIYEQVDEGDIVEINPLVGKIKIPEKGMEFSATTLPDFLMEIINKGGLVPYLATKIKGA